MRNSRLLMVSAAVALAFPALAAPHGLAPSPRPAGSSRPTTDGSRRACSGSSTGGGGAGSSVSLISTMPVSLSIDGPEVLGAGLTEVGDVGLGLGDGVGLGVGVTGCVTL